MTDRSELAVPRVTRLALQLAASGACAVACAAPANTAATVPSAEAPSASVAAAEPSSSQPSAAAAPVSGTTMAELLAAAQPGDFRAPDPENTLYLELASGRVVMELAPLFAPNHVANVKALVREGYFDGTAIVRVHENYVVQWADPDGKREIRGAQRTLPAEFERPAAGVPFAQ